MQIFSIYRPMISNYTSNISIFRTAETIAKVKIPLPILLLLPLYYHDSTIAKVLGCIDSLMCCYIHNYKPLSAHNISFHIKCQYFFIQESTLS